MTYRPEEQRTHGSQSLCANSSDIYLQLNSLDYEESICFDVNCNLGISDAEWMYCV